jgi:hypothetical protein
MIGRRRDSGRNRLVTNRRTAMPQRSTRSAPRCRSPAAGHANIPLRDLRGPPPFLRANQNCNGSHDRTACADPAAAAPLGFSPNRPCVSDLFLIRTEEERRTTGNTEVRMLLAETLTEQVIGVTDRTGHRTHGPNRSSNWQSRCTVTPAQACLKPSMNSAWTWGCGAQASRSSDRSPFRCSTRVSRQVTVTPAELNRSRQLEISQSKKEFQRRYAQIAWFYRSGRADCRSSRPPWPLTPQDLRSDPPLEPTGTAI